MQQLVPNQLNAHVPVNENFATLGWASVYGNDPDTTAGLHRGYLGGRWGGFTVAAVDHTFGASVTTYVCVTVATGALDFSTSSTNYLNTASYAPIETVVTGASAVTSTTDDRTAPGGVWNRAGGAGVGDALVANPLSQFAATSSAQLAGVISDETGTGALVFADSPSLSGTPTGPTAAPGTSTTQAASTAFVAAAVTAGGGNELKGLTFTSDTGSTADADSSAGFFWWNNATQVSATTLFFDNLTADAVSTTTFFASLGSTGFIYAQQSDDATKWQMWKWTAVTAGSGYYKFTVTLQASAGSIADNKTIYTQFIGAGGGSSAASAVAITDAGSYYVGTDVEAALQEAGASIAALGSAGLTRGAAMDAFNLPTFF